MKHCHYIAVHMASAIIKIKIITWKEKSPAREEACSWNVWLWKSRSRPEPGWSCCSTLWVDVPCWTTLCGHQICHIEGNLRKYPHHLSFIYLEFSEGVVCFSSGVWPWHSLKCWKYKGLCRIEYFNFAA